MTPAEKHRLAEAAMRGDQRALEALGNPSTLAELDAIMRDAFEAMSPSQQDAIAADAERELGQLDRTGPDATTGDWTALCGACLKNCDICTCAEDGRFEDGRHERVE